MSFNEIINDHDFSKDAERVQQYKRIVTKHAGEWIIFE